MIRVCCICDQIYGEKEPIEDTSKTHGYCDMCLLQAIDKIEWERRLKAQMRKEVHFNEED